MFLHRQNILCVCFIILDRTLQAAIVQWMFYGCSMDVRVLCSLDVLIYVLMSSIAEHL